MVKLASARESRLYDPQVTRNRWEYMNAGVYVFAATVLIAGFAALLLGLSVTTAQWGLIALLLSLALVAAVKNMRVEAKACTNGLHHTVTRSPVNQIQNTVGYQEESLRLGGSVLI